MEKEVLKKDGSENSEKKDDKKGYTSQSKKFFGIFDFSDFDKCHSAAKFAEAVKLSFGEAAEYYVILHDKDKYIEDVKDEKTGAVLHKANSKKIDHIHFMIQVPNKRTKQGFINTLLLGVQASYSQNDVKEQITASFCRNKMGCLRYLCHLDEDSPIETRLGIIGNEGKHKYQTSEVVTNNKNIFKMACANISDEFLSAAQLIDVCSESRTFKEVLLKIGSKNAVHYCQIIKALLADSTIHK